MPYTVRKVGDKFRVYKADTGDIAKNSSGTALDGGGHGSRDAAERQVRALYASENNKGTYADRIRRR